MKSFQVFEWTALALLIVGGFNWGMISAFNIDLVSTLFGDMTIVTRTVYALVGISALFMFYTVLNVSASPSQINRAART